MRLTNEQFIERCVSRHGDKYNYEKVEYTNALTKVCIICPKHGEFWQTPSNHLNGSGCPDCKRETLSRLKRKPIEQFIEEARSIHGDKYDYSKVVYRDGGTKICVVCRIHGDFMIRPNDHLKGAGCPKCGGVYQPTTEEFIEKAKSVHGDKYDYSKVKYVNNRSKVGIVCPEHGLFFQTPHNHLAGQGCPLCGYQARAEHNSQTLEDFINKANSVHGGKYDYGATQLNRGREVKITCPKHGEFEQSPHDHLQGCGCPACGYKLSRGENEIAEFIKSLGFSVKTRSRDLIKNREIDIYVPEKNVAVEFDGLLWHSERFKENPMAYHIDKTEKCANAGIRLIHVFEDEWTERRDIVKSMIANILGTTGQKIYARNCSAREISVNVAREFINENHIQGYCNCTLRYGLYHNGELVCVMTFGVPRQRGERKNNGNWELMRFCSRAGLVVVGGASKLFKHFLRHNTVNTVITYADKRWSIGGVYEKLGFQHIRDSKPNYFYVVGQRRKNRFQFRKKQLLKKGFDPTKSEHEIMLERKIYRIYDCGTMVFLYRQERECC